MRIKNNYRETIYWRAFKDEDTAYVFGLKQGIVNVGQTGDWRDDSFPRIKVEVKTGDIVFSSSVLASAGPVYNMTDDMIVGSDGRLVLDQVRLEKTGQQKTLKTSHVQFVDLRSAKQKMERTITSRLDQAFTHTELSEISRTHEVSWSIGGKVGGGIKAPSPTGGPEGSAEISGSFTDKVINALKNSSQDVINSVWSQQWQDKLTLTEGKIHAIEVMWTMVFDLGRASAQFGGTTDYSVIRSATPTLTKVSEYSNEPEVMQVYAKQWASAKSGAAAAA